MFQTASERIVGAMAGAAILLPAWHGVLREASEASAQIAPILGVAFLLVQFYAKTLEIRERKRRLDEDADD
jgi:hypothetical protein